MMVLSENSTSPVLISMAITVFKKCFSAHADSSKLIRADLEKLLRYSQNFGVNDQNRYNVRSNLLVLYAAMKNNEFNHSFVFRRRWQEDKLNAARARNHGSTSIINSPVCNEGILSQILALKSL